MASSTDNLAQNPDFSGFLSTTVGADSTGTEISVLSMFARLGVDPWRETAELMAMHVGMARIRLDTLIADFKDLPTKGPEREKIVSGLLARLPQQSGATNPSSNETLTGLALPSLNAPIYKILALALLVGLIAMLAQGY